MLIAILWVSKIALNCHHLHHQVLGGDVKKRVNAEKRHLPRFTGVDVEGFNLPRVQGFQPSEQRWINECVVDDATPHLLDKDSSMITETIHLDEDLKCYRSVDRHLKHPRTSIVNMIVVFGIGTR